MCYLAAAAALLFLGRDRVPAAGIVVHLMVLAAVAVATWHPRVPRWLRAWAPLLALLFLYTEMPMLIRAAGHGRFFDMTVISWETAIFGGQPAITWALHWPSLWISELLHLMYLAYYPIIFSVPLLLWFGSRREDFPEAVFTLLLTFVACFVCFVAFPVQGPRYLWPGPEHQGPVRALTLWLLEERSSRGTAFPSSHVAVATAQSVLAWRYFGARGGVVTVLTLGLAAGAVYGGFHYAIDVLAGGVLGLFTALTGLEIFESVQRVGGPVKATAPTNPPAASSASGSSTSSSGTAAT